MVKAMAPIKCSICADSETTLHKINENILGKELLTVISRLCVTEQQSAQQQVNEKACICTECAIEVLHVDQLLTKVRKSFAKKSVKVKANKTLDVTTNGNTTAATTTNADEFIFNCQTCGFETLKLKAYRQHMLKKHNESILKPYVCQLCESAFSRYDYYIKHQTLKHAKEEMVIKVELPDYSEYDDTEVNYEHHEELEKETDNNDDEQNGELFKCLECKYETEKPKVFKRHMIKTHNADKNNIFRCTKCAKSYARVYAYKQHVELMHRTDGSIRMPQFSCTDCERKFFTNMGLNMHLKKHAQAALAATKKVINEETLLNGATATSTPLNNKKNDISSNNSASVTAKNKHLLNVESLSKNTTPLSKKVKNSELVSKPVKKNAIDISTSKGTEPVASESIKRKHNAVSETLCNGSALKKKKKKKMLTEDLASETEELRNTQDEEEEEQTEENYICTYCQKILPSSKRLERHLKKRHT